ncbi:MAG TPA: IS30 family transposase, partial [Myxococcales bacterium]|nr:IS30 family transposase [Myxococcales bacterium]
MTADRLPPRGPEEGNAHRWHPRRIRKHCVIQVWSPQQISARLRFENPDDPELRVSHETIYQSL